MINVYFPYMFKDGTTSREARVWHDNEYIWWICGSLCVFIDGWPRKGILSPASLKWHWSVQKTFIYFGAKTTQRAVPMKTWDRKRRMKRVSQLGVRPWSSQSKVKGPTFQKLGVRLKQGVGKMTRWVSIFGCSVGFLQSSCDSHEHTYIEC